MIVKYKLPLSVINKQFTFITSYISSHFIKVYDAVWYQNYDRTCIFNDSFKTPGPVYFYT